jgi:DNA sulfur modification protein DndD
MKLLSLELYNFRQFYGKSLKISFAHTEEKNVTIIHGNNGSGKTALLNSLTWLLYETFTEALQAPEQLVNQRAIKEAKRGDIVQCWVLLNFEHFGKKYRLKRTIEIMKTDDKSGWRSNGPNSMELQWAEEDGKWKIVRDPLEVIGRILPKQLHRYFFLDGERIEKLQHPDKREEVVEATKMFIGEEIFIRAGRHLQQARVKLEGELKKLGDAETEGLINEKEGLETKVEEIHNEIIMHNSNIKGYKAQIKAIEESLRKQEKVQALQKRRDELKKQKEELKNGLQKTRIELANSVSNSGYKAFLKNAISSFKEMIDELRNRGELPSSIKTPFVEELLRRQICICERPLVPGDTAHAAVTAWLDKCGISDIEEVAIRMGAEVDALDREVPNLFNQIDKEKNQRAKFKEQLSFVESELEKISDQLKGNPEEEVRELQNKMDEAEEKMDQEKRLMFFKEEEIKRINEKIEEISKEILHRKSKNDQHELAKRRLEACIDAAHRIEEVQKRLRERFRLDLADRIKTLFSEISFKPYVPMLDKDYNLQLLESEDSKVAVGASTGENQVLSLAFIGAIVQQARLFTAKQDRLPGPDSSEFPIAMDSPFGNLDPIYRRQIATRIPVLANQVVIMISKSQWEGEVAQATDSKVGKEYILEYNSPKPDAEEATIERKGKVYSLVRKTSDEFESVSIEEVI